MSLSIKFTVLVKSKLQNEEIERETEIYCSRCSCVSIYRLSMTKQINLSPFTGLTPIMFELVNYKFIHPYLISFKQRFLEQEDMENSDRQFLSEAWCVQFQNDLEALDLPGLKKHRRDVLWALPSEL